MKKSCQECFEIEKSTLRHLAAKVQRFSGRAINALIDDASRGTALIM